MKKLLLFAILFALISLNAQSKKSAQPDAFAKYSAIFAKDLKEYSEAYNNKNWEGVASKFYPKLYDIAPKEALIGTLVALDTSGMQINFEFKNIDKVSETIKVGKELFCLFSYNCFMKITVSGKMLEAKEQLKAAFEAQYHADKMKFDETTNIFYIDAKQYMYAASKDNGKTWTYIEKNESRSYLDALIFPKKVIDKFKDFK